jgi:hypothetical protein
MADPEASNVDLRFRANLGMRIVTGATIALGALGVAALWGAWQAAGDNKTVNAGRIPGQMGGVKAGQ